ncbi:MAG TPA: gamma-glutamyltransferase, partial [Nevskiaceae bacterium]|nr:gamma-glutamyltransferase [Nevskiaceae bacterium]
YKVIERAPLVTWMQAYRIVTAPPPSAGGVTLAQVFGQLEALGWHGNGDVLAKHLLVESWRRAYHDRAQYLGDPDFVDVPIYRIAAHGYALALARGIDRAHATPSSTLDAQSRALHEGDHTSHFSIVDAQGNRVAATQTINTTFGCLCMAPGTGVVLNNEMDDFSAAVDASNVYGLVGSKANAIAPGKRPLSSMTPSFVEGPRGLLVLGTPGGSRIITMVTLGILDWISGGDTNSVVGAPRFHHQYLPDEIQFEPGAFSADEQAQLTALGHTLNPLSSTYGNMHAVWWDPAHDHLEAASDPRGVGRAQVVLSAKMPAPPPSK